MASVKHNIKKTFERCRSKMKQEEKDKNVQDALNKLISDEWFAGNVYKQFVLLVD